MMTAPGITPKGYIQSLCEKNGKNSDELARTARCIEKDMASFTDRLCFVYELLQNADDVVPKDCGTVTITLKGRYLIVSNNGTRFNYRDVGKICDYANADHNVKGDNDEQTGYKDVGFKSVFAVAYRVDIFSGEWQFHFDERSPRWNRSPGDNPYPWQIAPLWTEDGEIPAEIKTLLANENTSFVCYLRDVAATKTVLQRFVNSPESILFLKRIKTVSISIQGAQHVMAYRDGMMSVNGHVKSCWKRVELKLPLSDDVKKYLNTLNPSECPRRLKGKHEVTVSFCYQQQGEEFIAAREGLFYSTLPTSMRTGLPFLFDGPFSLNTSREQLPCNQLNAYLIWQIALQNFQYVRDNLVQRPSALRILAPDTITGINSELAEYFKICMVDIIGTLPLLPPHSGQKLLMVNAALIDLSGFYGLLHNWRISFQGFEQLVHPAIDSMTLLRRFPAIAQIGLQHVIAFLPSIIGQHPKVHICCSILKFFSKIFRVDTSYMPQDLQLFMRQKIFFNTRMELCSLEDVFLPSENLDKWLPPCVLVNVIHPKVINPALTQWLEGLGVRRLTPQILLEVYSKNLNHDSLLNKVNNLATIRLFFSLWVRSLISSAELRILSGIYLFNEQEKCFLSYQLYLPGCYQPQFPLEEDSPHLNEIFLSSHYFLLQDNIEEWKNFFLLLRVYGQCDLFFKDKLTVEELKQLPHSYVKEYLQTVFNSNDPPAKRGPQDKDDISPIFVFPFMKFLPYSPRLAKRFWEQIMAKENTILQGRETYHAKSAQRKLQDRTYLQRTLTTQSLISTANGPASTITLYAPSMESVVGHLVPTAKLSVKLSPQMETFLGFKTNLDAATCASILNYLKVNYKHDSYKLVMRQILYNLRKQDPHTFAAIHQWEFQAANGEWRTISQLKLWGLSHIPTPETATFIKPVFSETKELEEFCAYLNILPQNQIQNTNEFNAVPCDELKDFLRKKLPYIAFYWAKSCNFDKPAEEVTSTLLTKFNALKFFMGNKGDGTADLLDGCNVLYFPKWKRRLDRICTTLAAHFGFSSQDEINAFIRAIDKHRVFREGEMAIFEKYQKLFLQNETPAAAVSQQIEVPPQVLVPSPPSSPKANQWDMGNVPPPTTPPANNVKAPWSPTADAQDNNKTPEKPLVPKPGGWQPTVPANYLPRTPTKGQGNNTEKTGLSDLDKKRIGTWAEERAYTELKGRYSVVKENQTKVYEVVWHNNPAFRPAGYKDNELWDSGQHYDILVTRKEPGKPDKLKKYEVKGTTGSPVHFHFSGLEWLTYLHDPKNHRLWVITDVGTSDAQVTKIKDIMSAMKDHSLRPISSTEFVGYTTNR